MGLKEYISTHKKLFIIAGIVLIFQAGIIIYLLNKKPDITLGRIESQITNIAADQKDIKTNLAGIHVELKNLSRADSLMNNQLKYYPAAVPTNGNITSYYQKRKDPFTGAITEHTGVDIRAPKGTIVKATADGIVEETRYDSSGYGNEIIIDHLNGYKSLYGHLNEIDVKRKEYVTRGERIGTVGSTGKSTGNHLHYEISYNEKKINPGIFRIPFRATSLLNFPLL
jgi:murein DD-endopeptidase MepM/ murein hydrolase activator NlpD